MTRYRGRFRAREVAFGQLALHEVVEKVTVHYDAALGPFQNFECQSGPADTRQRIYHLRQRLREVATTTSPESLRAQRASRRSVAGSRLRRPRRSGIPRPGIDFGGHARTLLANQTLDKPAWVHLSKNATPQCCEYLADSTNGATLWPS
jgi:hypothetical protein